jgi:uncharacterized protein YfaS (alpha-2-macroglobulin family)
MLLALSLLSAQATAQHYDRIERVAPPAEVAAGLRFSISEGAAVEPVTELVPAAATVPLSAEALRALLARLPAFEADSQDRQTSALRDDSAPPPRSGASEAAPWPPTAVIEAPEPAAEAELRVLRHAPEGEVGLMPQLSITFSQPMVAVSSQAEAAAQVPALLEPQPAGAWRWLGSRTLVFEPTDGRFPMATRYQVSVPAGTRSAVGGALAQEHRFVFATPAPKLQFMFPQDVPQPLQPLLLMQFDQAVDLQAVLSQTRLIGPQRSLHPLQRVSLEEAQKLPEFEAQRAELVDGRWLALRPVEPLPKASAFRAEVSANLASLEGPRTTTGTQGWSFETYQPLAVAEWRCGWDSGKRRDCDPENPWMVELNNPLDAASFNASSIVVEPAVEDLQVDLNERHLQLRGLFASRTRYRILLPEALQDRFGQRLGPTAPLELQTGDAEPMLTGPDQMLVTLDPAAAPAVSVYSRGLESLEVEIHRVEPSQWGEYQTWLREAQSQDRPRPLPGRRLHSGKVWPGKAGGLTETLIALERYLDQGLGHLLLRVRPAQSDQRERWQQVVVWVQSTRLGLVAVHDDRQLTVWASELQTGRAAADVEIALTGGATAAGSTVARTSADGLARLPMLANCEAQLVLATFGADRAILPRSAYVWDPSTWQASPVADTLRWHVFDDRGMYRPGEQVRIKGWLRRLQADPHGDLQALAPSANPLRWKLADSRGVEIGNGQASLSALGGFDLAIDLPATPNLGHAHLSLEVEGVTDVASHSYEHRFQIQEFRRPEYEVSAAVEPGPHLIGGRALFEVSAAYYTGGGLSAAPVEWQLSATATRYVPPNRSDWSFGEFAPWWSPRSDGATPNMRSLSARTDALGRHQLQAEFLSVDPPRPSLLSAQATVTDLNRQAWSAKAELLVHPSAHYVGLKSRRSFVQPGEAVEVEALVVDIEGAELAKATPQLTLSRLVWKQQGREWREVAEAAQTCSPQRGSGTSFNCRWTPRLPGAYRVEATVQDAQGRANGSELRIWVAGGEGPPAQSVELQSVLLVPDQQHPLPGDTLQVYVQAPFAPAEGLLSLVRGGVLEQRRFALEGGSATLSIPIEESMVPGFELQVAVVGQAQRVEADGTPAGTRPAAASASLQIEVPPLARTLKVSATPRDTVLAPGGQTRIALDVRDANDQPVADAELAVVVVDESVLALSGYALPDPLAAFYAAWPSRSSAVFQHPQVLLRAKPKSPEAPGYGFSEEGTLLDRVVVTGSRIGGDRMERRMAMRAVPMAAAAPPSPPPAPAESAPQSPAIALRGDFSALALFAPEVRTDAQGRAEVELRLPDSLTRYRVMVVAVAGARAFGAAEASITARQPLMLRPSPPRFLNFGDRAELPLLVQNQTDRPMLVELGLRALNAGLPESAQPDSGRSESDHLASSTAGGAQSAGRVLSVPAQGRVEVRIPIAAQSAGRARFQAVVRSGDDSDAQRFDLPVWTPATREAFSTYGSLDAQSLAVQPVRAPADALPQYGGLKISLASTELQALTDAVLYLAEYPFECNEQLASRVLGVTALADVLQAFGNRDLPAPAELDAAVKRDLERLEQLQNYDGGWSFWQRDQRSWPYLSIHVAHALARAADKGRAVPEHTREDALGYLRDIERMLPDWYDPESRRSLRAYALDVRRRLGDVDPAEARALLAEVQDFDRLSIETIGWLLPSLAKGGATSEVEALLRHVEQQVAETAGNAHFVTARTEQGAHVLLHSDRRADGVMLDALMELRPQHDLIEKLVRGLLAHRVQGRWGNTQENAFVLLAVDRYFRLREGVSPEFVARVWLDQGFAGEHAFRGRSGERFELGIPMAELAEIGSERALLLQKEGPGRLYYRIGLDYVPQNLSLAPADHGFTVQRRYVGVDDPADVRQDADGSWHIRAGAKVRVEIDMVATARRYHVALIDPLPAGLEAINPALAVSESVQGDPAQEAPHSRWQRSWYEHQNLRDERVEAFTSLLWEGVHRYSYVARATTPGEFVVPPTRAEEMYQPETFGRSGTDRVVVESL